MAEEANNAILGFPRIHLFEDLEPFTPWKAALSLLRRLESEAIWLPRSQAEQSDEIVQPIPSALVMDPSGRYLIVQRIERDRADMSRRLSLVFGGHVDEEDRSERATGLEGVLLLSLERELSEELSVVGPLRIAPLGLVFDNVSPRASRHIGVVFRIIWQKDVKIGAEEEFVKDSALTARFLSVQEIRGLEKHLDPWSAILLRYYLVEYRQIQEPLDTDWS